jgi:hypothetical protein
MNGVLRAHPGLPEAEFFLGMVYLEKRDVPHCKESLEACLQRSSEIPEESRKVYEEAASGVLTLLRSGTPEDVELHSQVDSSLAYNPSGKKLDGIEVPFTR